MNPKKTKSENQLNAENLNDDTAGAGMLNEEALQLMEAADNQSVHSGLESALGEESKRAEEVKRASIKIASAEKRKLKKQETKKKKKEAEG